MTAAAVIPRLAADVTVFTSGDPVPQAFRTVTLPLDTGGPASARSTLSAPGGGTTAHGLLHWAPTATPGHTDRLATIAAWVAEHRPAVFVVDVSAEVAAFVRLLGIPVVSVTLPGRRDDHAHVLGYGLSDAVIAAWPDGIGPSAASAPADRLHRVGALSRFAPVESGERPAPNGPVVVLHGSGGRGDDPVSAAAEGLRRSGAEVHELRGAPEREVWQRLQSASVVVSHGGANAVAEIAAARRPAILIPDARPHDEQDHLAASLLRAGLPCRIVTPGAVAHTDWTAELAAAAALDGSDWCRWNDGAAAGRIADLLLGLAGGARNRTVAVITTVAGRRAHLTRQQERLATGQPPHLRVIVAMDDEPVGTPAAARADTTLADDGRTTMVLRVPRRDGSPLPLAEARNAGAEAAIAAGADLLVFLDVDCLPRPGLLAAYRDASVREPDALLSGAVTYLPEHTDYSRPDTFDSVGTVHGFRPRPRPGILEPADHDLFWSLSFACTVPTWRRIGGFDEGYSGYGGEDTDFGSTARAAGVELLFVGGAEADHQYHPVSDPPVEHLDDIVRNAARFRQKWGRQPMRGWLDAFEAEGLIRLDPATDTYARTPAGAAARTTSAAAPGAVRTPAPHAPRTPAAAPPTLRTDSA
jgi:hypothetical protein